MEIIRKENGSKGQFQALKSGLEVGLMTYSVAGKDKIIIDHTEVSPSEKGNGVGQALVMEAVKYARHTKIMILPLCPFARSVFAKNKEIRDVLV
ncbi:GNAT family N-acetyltransferase [Pararhodonellum marinum]|uniref:GNAT family N-acetyltransferase n=1 Tax=Pararhodonellum marinum TaxID=2755358 RepID=UPI001890569C|nr:GNAT family N-acetyltransferase [Pararhodonellum marinum]